jgi:hypothetical protein
MYTHETHVKLNNILIAIQGTRIDRDDYNQLESMLGFIIDDSNIDAIEQDVIAITGLYPLSEYIEIDTARHNSECVYGISTVLARFSV